MDTSITKHIETGESNYLIRRNSNFTLCIHPLRGITEAIETRITHKIINHILSTFLRHHAPRHAKTQRARPNSLRFAANRVSRGKSQRIYTKVFPLSAHHSVVLDFRFICVDWFKWKWPRAARGEFYVQQRGGSGTKEQRWFCVIKGSLHKYLLWDQIWRTSKNCLTIQWRNEHIGPTRRAKVNYCIDININILLITT